MTFITSTVAVATITFEDFVYFNSREENRVKEMLPVLHNIALQYAFKNATSNYRIHELVPDYVNEIERSLHPYYIYPAMPVIMNDGSPDIINVPAAMKTTMFPIGWQSDNYRTFSSRTSTNLLQYATVKVANPGNVFVTFVASSLPFDELSIAIPRVARLGKLSSKIAIHLEQARFSMHDKAETCPWLISPIDLPSGLKLGRDYAGSLHRMNPSDLMRDVHFTTPIPFIDVHYGNQSISIPACYHFQGMIKP